MSKLKFNIIQLVVSKAMFKEIIVQQLETQEIYKQITLDHQTRMI